MRAPRGLFDMTVRGLGYGGALKAPYEFLHCLSQRRQLGLQSAYTLPELGDATAGRW